MYGRPDCFDQHLPIAVEVARMVRPAEARGEDQPVFLPNAAKLEFRGPLVAPVVLEHTDGFGIERHTPDALLGFRGAETQAVIPGNRQALRDPQGPIFDVRPTQPQQLATSHAGRQGQVNDRVQPVLAGKLEETLRLFGLPDAHLTGLNFHGVNVLGDVARNQVPTLRLRQRLNQQATGANGGGGPHFLQDVALHFRDLQGAQFCEQHVTDARHNVPGHVKRVQFMGTQFPTALLVLQPLLEVLLNGQPVLIGQALIGNQTQQIPFDDYRVLLGFGCTVPEDQLPLSIMLSSRNFDLPAARWFV